MQALLLEFAVDNTSVGDLAATAAMDWIDADAESVDEILPRDFGDYQLLEIIGRGGMGIVYRATQKSLGRPVCIKLAPVGTDERARLIREAQLAGELHHPNIVSVFDAGIHDERSYIAMELVEGQPLSNILASQPLSAIEAASMMKEICDAIKFAHQRQILHRDLKPSNVIVDTTGRPRVADFGLAKRLQLRDGLCSESKSTETLTGIAGSPSYMAPEQVRDETLGVRTDVYGLGTVLYEMLSGRPPLVGNTPLETMRLVETTPPVELSRLQVGLSKDLETICHKCLEKRPGNRYQNVAELRDDLSRFLEGLPVLARPIGRTVRLARWVNRNRSLSTAIGVVILSALMSVAGLAAMLSRTQSALERTTNAEANQRELADELRRSVDGTNRALYRSLIVQASQSLVANDVKAARRSLEQVEASESLMLLRGLEYSLFHRQAWPATESIDADGRSFVDVQWCNATGSLVVLDEHGRLTTYSAAGDELQTSEAMRFDGVEPTKLCTHPTRPQAIVSDGNQIYEVELDTMEVIRRPDFPESIREITLLPEQRLVAGIDDRGKALSLDLQSGQHGRILASTDSVRHLRFSPSGRFVAFLNGSTVMIARGDLLALTDEPRQTDDPALLDMESDSWPIDLSWIDDSAIVTLDENGNVHAYRCTKCDNQPVTQAITWTQSSMVRNPESLGVSGSQVVVIGANEMVGLSGTNGQVEWRHARPPSNHVRIAPSRRLVVYTDPDTEDICVSNIDTLAAPQITSSSSIPVRKVSFGNHGRTVAWRDVDGQITVRNNMWKQPSITLAETTNAATGIALNPRQDQLAASRDNSVIIYDLPQLRESIRVSGHTSSVWSLAYSHNGKLIATGDSSGRVLVSDTTSGTQIRKLDGLVGDIRAIEFGTDDKFLVVADSSSNVKRYDLSGKRIVSIRLADAATINSIAMLPEETIAIADSAGRIHIRNLDDGSESTKWMGHNGAVWSVVAIGNRILSAGQDGNLRIWNTSGELFATLSSQQEPIWSIATSKNINRLFGCTTAGSVFSIAW
ncbi:hypothetical protein GCM10023156_23710 [Novipirellula rosea]|uniref:Protein kinase domain-containing protein n=1 Tax=Novipirellula rosea TaxID=1031540 RepID=A0ABP8MN40_9BACT